MFRFSSILYSFSYSFKLHTLVVWLRIYSLAQIYLVNTSCFSFLWSKLKALEDEIFRRTLTYSLWNHSTNRTDPTGWHPVTFDYENAEQQYIEKIKVIYYPQLALVGF